MNDLLAALAVGVGLGFGAAVPPGPVNFEITRRIPSGGWLSGASVGFGAVTVDLVLALLLVGGVLDLINATPWIRLPISAIGVLLLFRLGIGSIRSGMVKADDSTSPPPLIRATPIAGYATGLALCSTSPYQAAFWLTGVPAILDAGDVQQPLGVVTGVFAATLAWVLTWSSVVRLASAGGRGPKLTRAADLIGGGLLTLFGCIALSGLVRQLL